MLVRLLVTSVMLGNNVNGSSTDNLPSPPDPALEWFSFLFKNLFQVGKLSVIFLACGSREWESRRRVEKEVASSDSKPENCKPIESMEDSSMLVTADQLILLNILLSELG